MYSLLWKAARPWLRKHKRLRENFEERLVPPHWPYSPAMQAAASPMAAATGSGTAPANRLIWLQAASGGEAYLAWELVKRITALVPGLPILATTCTRQGLEVLQRAQLDPACPGLDLAVNYLPLDEKPLLRRALRQAFGPALPQGGPQPLLALLETEIWPGLLAACRTAGIGSAVINARMTEGSFKAYRLLAPWLRRYAPQAVLATASDDLNRFCRVFDRQPGSANDPQAPLRGLMPNMKFDRLSLDCTLGASPAKLPPGGLLLLASLRREEEDEISAQLPQLLELARQTQSCLVLAPRHLHRVEAWRAHLYRQGLTYQLRSASPALDQLHFKPGQAVLWDCFGELQTLYQLAAAVFVGGSLAPLGGQNFLEPLACGLVPCLGPHWSNFYWVGEDLFRQGLARRVQSAADLPATLLDLLSQPRPRIEVQAQFQAYLTPRRGGTAQAAALLLRLAGIPLPDPEKQTAKEAAHERR